MPDESHKDKQKRKRAEAADGRAQKKLAEEEEKRVATLLASHPEPYDRAKLALARDNAWVAGKTVAQIVKFYQISNAAYYKVKTEVGALSCVQKGGNYDAL